MSRIFTALTTFWYVDKNGDSQLVHEGTRVAEGHSMLEGREEFFTDVEVALPVIESDAPRRGPGRPRKNPEA